MRLAVRSFDDLLTPKMTRRTAVATVVGTAALVATEFAVGRRFSSALVTTSRNRPKSNTLLISFDALTAEDMSLYGRRLPTTPNIDAFAKTSTVFTQFCSASTFTTPCIGVMMTGGYPSDTFVYGLSGQVPSSRADQNVARVLREAGYKTAAFPTNPWAYYLAQSLKPGFDLLPDPKFHPGRMQDLWAATTPLHQNSGVGSRIDEYFDLEQAWNAIAGHQTSLAFRYRPGATVREAQQLRRDLPDGFLWVHGMPPHHLYLPSKPEQGRFLPQQEVQSFKDEPWTHWKPHYPPDQRGTVDRHRLAYDEFICSTDRHFGDLLANLERSGRPENTTIILSADHGESFEGGIYQHQTPYLTRPVIHVPLIIRGPGQTEGRRVDVPTDQTCLAPTIVDLAGMPKPVWMRGQSLVPFLNSARAIPLPDRLAFSQYLERNSIFKALRKGTLGVIDGKFQYVVYLDSQRGELRPLTQAQYWNIDRSAEFPEKVESLRAALKVRFPGLVT
jgi:arylsulfatase A-like enzyme